MRFAFPASPLDPSVFHESRCGITVKVNDRLSVLSTRLQLSACVAQFNCFSAGPPSSPAGQLLDEKNGQQIANIKINANLAELLR